MSSLQQDLSEMENGTDNKITALKTENNQTSKALEVTKLDLESEYIIDDYLSDYLFLRIIFNYGQWKMGGVNKGELVHYQHKV